MQPRISGLRHRRPRAPDTIKFRLRRDRERRSLHRGEGGRRQYLIDDVADDLAVLFGLGARGDPVGIALKRRPFLLALGKRFPRQQIGQFLIGFADQRGEEPARPDAVLLPQLQRGGLEALQQRRQPPRHTAIDAHFVNHRLHSLLYYSYRYRERFVATIGAFVKG